MARTDYMKSIYLTMEMLKLRSEGKDIEEDAILDKLDICWHMLSNKERYKLKNFISRYINKNGNG